MENTSLTPSEFLSELIEEYKDGRVSSYLMLSYLNTLKTMI